MPKGDIFNNDATGSLKGVIDAASKILMGVKDDDTAAAQTEEDHPIVKGQNEEMKPVKSEMKPKMVKSEKGMVKSEMKPKMVKSEKGMVKSEMKPNKEEMKPVKSEMKPKMVKSEKGMVKSEMKPNKEEMDPVNKKALKGKHKDRDDKDIDNDGDVDSSDKYLHKKRKAISKAMKKDGEEMDEANDVNDVEHAEFGLGNCIPGMHTLEEDENGDGYVTHYDVMFKDEDGEPFIVEDVAIEEMKVIKSMNHGHKKGK